MSRIPKIIHYCWVGGAPKPKSVLYCLASWKKFCPDYEIIEWNESNYDFHKNNYMSQAYEAKKWGFVPDYARLDIIYEYGGIYLDTDVEIIRSFDELLEQEAFMGFEETGDGGDYYVNCGQGFGAVPHHEIIKKAREIYDHLSFKKEDGSLNMLASPHYTTQALRQFGLLQVNKKQELPGMTIFTSDVLCPKNFTTGEINITPNTVSIHHFTASWLDEKIKAELAYQQKMKNRFGEKNAQKAMYVQSVIKKYASAKMLLQLPSAIVNKVKTFAIRIIEDRPYIKGLKDARRITPGNEPPVLLDTALLSDNAGDQIIMENCLLQLSSVMNTKTLCHVPTHAFTTNEQNQMLYRSSLKILCGTNILSGYMRNYGLWKLKPEIAQYKNTLLLGIGMASYNDGYDKYTKEFFDAILSKDYVHSVRDSFSEALLKKIGIENVINTGCPTMWNFTPEFCKSIPHKKGSKAICTITDYSRDIQRDKRMFDIVCGNYETVYLWLQGINDETYLDELGIKDNLIIVNRTLEDFDQILMQVDLDYIGTRLHAGIRALSFKHRSIIIAIDNRAESIAKDTGLPIVFREDIDLYLDDRIKSDFETKIEMPIQNIEKWKAQFIQ